MYGRVASGSMSLKEYESWKQYLEAMKGKVNNGEIPPEDLTAFVNYSRTMDITRSNPVSEVPKREPERSQGRVVKPFVPERISRSDLERKPEEPQPEPVEIPRPQPRREGFFTSPSVERQRQGKPPVSHIIRAGEPRDYQPQPAFVPEYPLGAQEPAFAPETRSLLVPRHRSGLISSIMRMFRAFRTFRALRMLRVYTERTEAVKGAGLHTVCRTSAQRGAGDPPHRKSS